MTARPWLGRRRQIRLEGCLGSGSAGPSARSNASSGVKAPRRASKAQLLMFLALAGFLFLRSDPEVWPLGDIGPLASLRDVEVLQHRIFVVLIAAFAIFEWRVRTKANVKPWARLVFPLLCVTGGMLLLTHSHAIANVKDQLLIELTHTPLAVAGIVAGCARWLELRLDPRGNPIAWRVAHWLWPVCFILVGLMLLNYREA